ncbi:MAG: hypothetical protein L3I99_03160 [Sulfurimonas sp.]|nr:hypothetical protein [Sulfurimonas sp.]
MSKITRQSVYILIISVFLLTFVLLFSFLSLIPEGKEYRKGKTQLFAQEKDLKRYQNFESQTYDTLKKLQSDNRHIIIAFDKEFSPQRFIKKYKSSFNSLEISKIEALDQEEGFSVYDVKTSSQISAPSVFYKFLDEINKSDWIVMVNFPIEFKRDGEVLNSSFKIKVYSNAKDLNTSKLVKK